MVASRCPCRPPPAVFIRRLTSPAVRYSRARSSAFAGRRGVTRAAPVDLRRRRTVRFAWRGVVRRSAAGICVVPRLSARLDGIGHVLRSVATPGRPRLLPWDFHQNPSYVAGARREIEPPRRAAAHGRADASERGADAELLANGPEPGRSDLNPFAAATEVPERSLIAAASALGARTRKGQGWLRG